jgi:hypothetical protein
VIANLEVDRNLERVALWATRQMRQQKRLCVNDALLNAPPKTTPLVEAESDWIRVQSPSMAAARKLATPRVRYRPLMR